MAAIKKLKTCDQGHQFYKSSDCPTCPQCEALRKPINSFLARIAAPARRALQSHGISTLEQLSKYSEKEILEWHGMGPSSIPKLKEALKEVSLNFRKE